MKSIQLLWLVLHYFHFSMSLAILLCFAIRIAILLRFCNTSCNCSEIFICIIMLYVICIPITNLSKFVIFVAKLWLNCHPLCNPFNFCNWYYNTFVFQSVLDYFCQETYTTISLQECFHYILTKEGNTLRTYN